MLENRIRGFDTLSRIGKTVPFCLMRGDDGTVGFILEDITQGNLFPLKETKGAEDAVVCDPVGEYSIFIDPDSLKHTKDFDEMMHIGRTYVSALLLDARL